MRYLISFLLIIGLVVAASAQEDDEVEFDLPITESVTYTIRAGDTLDTVGALFDVSVECLRETNDLSRFAIIQPGDPLVISIDCPAYAGAMTVRFPREDAPEETTLGIDEVPDPMSITDIEPVEIIIVDDEAQDTDDIDDEIEEVVEEETEEMAQKEPDTTPAVGGGSGQIYTLEYGDTLDQIAQEFNVSLTAILVANEIENRDIRDLQPGREILIPADAPPYGQAPALNADGTGSGSATASGGGYVVQRGETVDGISARFNVDTECVLEANEIMFPPSLRPGMVLQIPSDCPEYSGYDVVPPEAQRES